jgi:hypothetical protein
MADVTDVQEIEDAVALHDRLAGRACPRHTVSRFLEAADLRLVCHGILSMTLLGLRHARWPADLPGS